jgi:hypothetical protein
LTGCGTTEATIVRKMSQISIISPCSRRLACDHRPMADRRATRAQSAFRAAQEAWRKALAAHRLAPPDAGFSGRLEALASAAKAEADACREADATGFAWPPHRAADSGPPYELRPESGRRGPAELWHRFDDAVIELNRAAAGSDLLAVAAAYDEVADVAAELAVAVARDDRSSGLLVQQRARRSA